MAARQPSRLIPARTHAQGVQFGLFAGLFLAYLGVAVYGSDPGWTTRQLLRQPAGQAGLVLISTLMAMTFGQVRARWGPLRAAMQQLSGRAGCSCMVAIISLRACTSSMMLAHLCVRLRCVATRPLTRRSRWRRTAATTGAHREWARGSEPACVHACTALSPVDQLSTRLTSCMAHARCQLELHGRRQLHHHTAAAAAAAQPPEPPGVCGGACCVLRTTCARCWQHGALTSLALLLTRALLLTPPLAAPCCLAPCPCSCCCCWLAGQLFVVLVALEVLLLCLRSLYFFMAVEQVGALLRMVLIVIKVCLQHA